MLTNRDGVETFPAPGSVYKEFTHREQHGSRGVMDYGATFSGALHLRKTEPQLVEPFTLTIDDLDGAVKAELVVEYWGGHIGTSHQGVHVNGNPWVAIPQPLGTPGHPALYYRTVLGGRATPIPLDWLKTGENEFHFTCGKQIAYSFEFGLYWVYAFTVRVYYGSDRAHATARIESPAAGARLSDKQEFTVATGGAAVLSVDLVGRYTDFNWSGDGLFREWHHQYVQGILQRHIGMSVSAPHTVLWDASWVPDQSEPIEVVARVTDANGVSAIMPAVSYAGFERPDRSVAMYSARSIPEKFGVRIGEYMTCALPVTGNVGKAKAERLVLSTWSAAHADAIGLNGTTLVERVGPVHDVSFDSISVPVELLRQGDNEFFITSETEHHMAEVNWPGPVLLVEYGR